MVSFNDFLMNVLLPSQMACIADVFIVSFELNRFIPFSNVLPIVEKVPFHVPFKFRLFFSTIEFIFFIPSLVILDNCLHSFFAVPIPGLTEDKKSKPIISSASQVTFQSSEISSKNPPLPKNLKLS